MTGVICDIKFLRLKRNEHAQSFIEIMRKIDKQSYESTNIPDPMKTIETKVNSLVEDLNMVERIAGKNLIDIARLKAIK